jgi:importin subunit alpha-6/7
VLEAGAIPVLIRKLVSSKGDLKEQIFWALGNIAGENDISFDELMEHNAFELIVQELQGESTITKSVGNGVWTLMNLLRGARSPPLESLRPAIDLFKFYMSSPHKSSELDVDLRWALNYITSKSDDHIQLVLDAGLVPLLVSSLMSGDEAIQVPSLRTIGDICSGNEAQVQVFFSYHHFRVYHAK